MEPCQWSEWCDRTFVEGVLVGFMRVCRCSGNGVHPEIGIDWLGFAAKITVWMPCRCLAKLKEIAELQRLISSSIDLALDYVVPICSSTVHVFR